MRYQYGFLEEEDFWAGDDVSVGWLLELAKRIAFVVACSIPAALLILVPIAAMCLLLP